MKSEVIKKAKAVTSKKIAAEKKLRYNNRASSWRRCRFCYGRIKTA